MGFGKLWSKVTSSSLWSEPLHIRVVFVSMLSQADANGFVESSQAGIARLANVTLDQARDAIRVLESPDPDSGDLERNPENEGRRIEKVSAGWHVINYVDYRDRRDTDKRREYQRDLMRKKRSTEKLLAKTANMLAPVSTPLAPVSTCEHPLAQAEAEAEAEAENTSNVISLPVSKEGMQGESAKDGQDKPAPASGKSKKKVQTAEEIIQEFENDATYAGINVRNQWGRMAAWCRTNHKHPTKRRFLNWLNRVEIPINANGSTKTYQQSHNVANSTNSAAASGYRIRG